MCRNHTLQVEKVQKFAQKENTSHNPIRELTKCPLGLQIPMHLCNSRDCRFPCTLTQTIILFAYIGYNKRAPSTISSSQCHIPHIEIILVIMKFESGKPKHQLRFTFNTLLMCTGLLSQLKLRKSLYFPAPSPPSPPHIFFP